MKSRPPLVIKMTYVGAWDADVVLIIGAFNLLRPWVVKNVLNERKDELLKHLDDKELAPDAHNYGRTFNLAGGGSLIWLSEYRPTIFVHEAMHAVQHMLTSKATPLSEDTAEAYGYLMQHLYKSLAPNRKGA